MIASTLLNQRAPSRHWYRNKQTSEEAKGFIRVHLADDPNLQRSFALLSVTFGDLKLKHLIRYRFGLNSSVFTMKYFGITMRAAQLKAAVKDQVK
jgi:hypothetical protein